MSDKKVVAVRIFISALLVNLSIAVERSVCVDPRVLDTQLNALFRKAEEEARAMFWKGAYVGLDSIAGICVKITLANNVVIDDNIMINIEKDAEKIQDTDREVKKQIHLLFDKADGPLGRKIISTDAFKSQKVS